MKARIRAAMRHLLIRLGLRTQRKRLRTFMKLPIAAIALCLALTSCSSVDAMRGKWYTNADCRDTTIDFYPSGRMKHFQQGSTLHSPIIHGYDKLISHGLTAVGADMLAFGGGGAPTVATKLIGGSALVGHSALTNTSPAPIKAH